VLTRLEQYRASLPLVGRRQFDRLPTVRDPRRVHEAGQGSSSEQVRGGKTPRPGDVAPHPHP
jgi:hypothetical protein